MKSLVVSLALLMSVFALFAQENKTYEDEYAYLDAGPVFNAGLGLGLDYGGIGTRLSLTPQRGLALFAGLGYNFVGFGFNGGLSVRLLPDKQVSPTLLAMYGYNAVILVDGLSELNDAYYGVSIGAGVEFRSSRNNNFWNLEILLPFRSQAFRDDWDAINQNPLIEVTNYLPVTFSVGYHFSLR